MVNIPVLTTGTMILATIKPIVCFFFKKENANPANRPARVVFNKHKKTVANGLRGIKIAKVDGEKSTNKPLKKPSVAPDKGPNRTAAKTIVTNERLMLTGPNCK